MPDEGHKDHKEGMLGGGHKDHTEGMLGESHEDHTAAYRLFLLE